MEEKIMKTGFRGNLFFATLIVLCCLNTGNDALGKTFPEVMFILDASGSMWGEVAGEVKIEVAKTVLTKVVPELPPEVKTGLTAYGHHRKGDCKDIEIIIPPGSDDRASLLAAAGNISPKGKTPIAGSIQMITERLKQKENETTIILLSDGEETCDPEPCEAVKKLKNTGVHFVLYVVGFDVNKKQQQQLVCLAEAGEGEYFRADDPDALLAAFESVHATVAKKVEKAKTTRKKTATRLGKITIKMPASTTVSLNKFLVRREKDGKVLKTIKDPAANSTHPLLSGDYEVIAGFANSNYKPDSEVSFGVYTVTGGETTELNLGALAINLADSLKDIPAGAVVIERKDGNQFSLTLPYTGNSYYFYKTKPLPAGVYDFAVHYKKSYLYQTEPTKVVLGRNVEITEGQESIVTVDSGITIMEPAETSMTRWTLVPVEGDTPALDIRVASNGDHPLWKKYAVMPGIYQLKGYIEGMTEPLPLGEDLKISHGDLLEVDTGL